ncbi:hypothetical protein BX070DRAFT_264757 [Coemansia spiralis]|nr:hypothetical protein BX070DRAFT_264757 [Coemansia spiralis]
MHADTGCRIIFFFNNSFATLPSNLCIYCVVYLQLVISHNVTPHKQWPQAMLMTLAVLFSVVPASAYLYVPVSHAGLSSYCTWPSIFNHKLYVFFTLSTAMWGYLSGVVGVISVTIIGIHILRAQKKTQHILHMSTDTYGPSRLVVRQSKSDALHHTLSVFLGIALIVNPVIRNVYTEQIKERFKAARRKSNSASQPLQPSANHSDQQILSSLHFRVEFRLTSSAVQSQVFDLCRASDTVSADCGYPQSDPAKQWPQVTLMTLAVLISVVPASAYLYVPPSQIGINSYCTLPVIFHRKMYIFFTLSTSMWVYLSGVVGIISVTIIGIYILRTQKKTQSILLVSAYSYEPPNLVLQQSRANALHHTLVTIIWYPITPVISLWLNTILITVAYYTHREYPALEYINVVLLGLQSVFLGIALIVNPVIRTFTSNRSKSDSKPQDENPTALVSHCSLAPTTATSKYYLRYTFRVEFRLTSSAVQSQVFDLCRASDTFDSQQTTPSTVVETNTSMREWAGLSNQGREWLAATSNSSVSSNGVNAGPLPVASIPGLKTSFAQLPANLCIYCVVYLQIVVIHNVTPRKQWPQAMLMTLAVLISVVPASAFLYVPPTQIGINSYCMWPSIFNHKLHYQRNHYWNIHIAAQKKTQSILLVSAYSYEPPNLVLQQSRANALHHTLVTIIWYPITPVISLWLNTILITVAYYTHREYPALEYINVVLLGLQSVFLGIALIVNPVIRNVYIEQIKKRFKAARRKSNSASQPLQPSANHSEQQILSSLHFRVEFV